MKNMSKTQYIVRHRLLTSKTHPKSLSLTLGMAVFAGPVGTNRTLSILMSLQATCNISKGRRVHNKVLDVSISTQLPKEGEEYTAFS